MAWFSDRERRGVVVLLPLMGLFLLGVRHARLRVDPADAERMEAQWERPADTVELFPFDPNTVTFRELRRLGLTASQAASLLKYREAGKVFAIPEEVAACYGIDDSLYFRLEPWIRIGREFAVERRRFPEHPLRHARRGRDAEPLVPFRIDTAGAAFLAAATGLSERQTEVLLHYRAWHGIRSAEDLAGCFVVDSALMARLAPWVIYPEPEPAAEPLFPVEINRADSAALRRVYGIGERSVGAILDYRERLGGFYRVEQLAEVREVLESNYEKILRQICCDSCEIQKIDINFAPPEALKRHPYVTARALRRLLKLRQLKGGWSTAEELVEDHIFTREEAARLAPYLRFGQGTEISQDDRPL